MMADISLTGVLVVAAIAFTVPLVLGPPEPGAGGG